PVLRTYPSVPPILYAVSGIVLLVYGFLTARSQPVQPAAASDPPKIVDSAHEMRQGFSVGLLLIVLNPAAIVTWVVIMGSLMPESTPLEGLSCAIGVFCGSFGWFALVAYLTQKGKHVLGDKAAWIPRIVGIALMLYAVYLLAKAVKLVVIA